MQQVKTVLSRVTDQYQRTGFVDPSARVDLAEFRQQLVRHADDPRASELLRDIEAVQSTYCDPSISF
ncbi:hypothetical protein [Lentisalinibacter salinarum]|uniref:hypothetical protein n=1 Tax=Lentisalinibacter salinarum TaxID=2992239 RepID=UPI003864738A